MVMSLTRYQTIKSIKVPTKVEPNTYNYFIIYCLSLESLQNFCSTSAPSWPPESVLRIHLGPLGQSCVNVCQRSSHMCEPALFHHLNSPAAFTRWQISILWTSHIWHVRFTLLKNTNNTLISHFFRLGIGCSSIRQGVNHIFPSYSPWGRHCNLQQEPLLFSCAGFDPKHRRLCPCSAQIPGQVALCPDCL